MAFALYLTTAAALLIACARLLGPMSRAAAVAVLLLPLVFTGRALLTGRVYAPADLSFESRPHYDYAADLGAGPPHNRSLSDVHAQMIPWKAAVRAALARGEWPLWNPYMLAGDILASAAQPAAYDPLQVLSIVLPLPDAVTYGVTMTFFLAGLFTFLFARDTGLGEIASLVAAAGFAFSGMMALFAGWPHARAWAFLPLVLLGVRRVVKGSGWPLTAALVLLVLAGHPESLLHVVTVGVLYGISLRPALRVMAMAAGAGVLAALLTAFYLLPLAEAIPQTVEHGVRKDYYAQKPYDAIVADYMRAVRIARTFGDFGRGHAQDPTARVGFVVMALAFAAPFLSPRRSWFFALLALACLSATFGVRPVPHLLHSLPLYDMALNERLAFAASFAMAMLAAVFVERVPGRAIPAALLAFVLMQRTAEDGGVYPVLPRKAFYPETPIIAAVPRDARLTGIGMTLLPNSSAIWGLEDVRGYEAMTLRRLYETYPLWCVPQGSWFNRVDDLNRPFLSFLNVGYALADASLQPPTGWSVLALDRGTGLFRNHRVLPRAFVPDAVQYVRGNPVGEMARAAGFTSLAWIEADYPSHRIANGPGTIRFRRDGSAFEIDAAMQGDGWVVVSESAWKGWRAWVDGRRVRVHYANHAFLGVFVPRGRHHVRLVYLPDSFTRGRAVAAATALVLVGVGVGRRRKKR